MNCSTNILINAMSVHPKHGSEFGFAWNWILEISKRYEYVHVHTSIHQDNQDDILRYIEEANINNLKFNFISFPKWVNVIPFNFLKRYLKYWAWHFKSYRKAKTLKKSINLSLVHQLNTIGFRIPGFMFLLNLPVVWGPIGAGEQYDYRLFSHLRNKAKINKLLYNIINKFQWSFSPYINYCFRRANIIITSTSELANLVSKKCFFNKDKVFHIPETAAIHTVKKIEIDEDNKSLKLCFAGLLHDRKNLKFVLDALIQLDDIRFSFYVCGKGPLENYYKDYVKNHNIKGVYWYPWLSKEECSKLIASSDIFVLPSIREANSSVIFEALSQAKPVISLDISGMSDTIINGKNGFKIPISSNRSIMVNDLSLILKKLLNDFNLLRKLSEGALTSANKHLYSNRIDELQPIYYQAIQNFYKLN